MRKSFVVTLLFFLLLLAVWELAYRLSLTPDYLFPSPVTVTGYLIGAVDDGSLPLAFLLTIKRLIAGYALGILVGLPTGMICGRFSLGARTVGVLALAMQALPSVCWVPLALLWFGQSESAMLFIVVMGSLWSVLLAAQHGLQSVPPIYISAARTLGSRGLHTALFVRLPAALPSIIQGMKQGWAFAWRSLMAAEIYVTVLSGFGLGHLLHYGRELLAMEQVLGIMLVIMMLGVCVDRIIFGPVEYALQRRWGILRA